MSLINQVLNDLEKRGASTRLGEATVRVVPLRQGHGKRWLIFAVVSVTVLAATIVWLKWDIEIRFNAPSSHGANVPVAAVHQPPAVAEVPAAVVSITSPVSSNLNDDPASSASATKPLSLKAPAITAVSPNPAISLGVPQNVTINGIFFSNDVKVTLRTPTGKVYANRKIVMQNSSQIVVNPNFGDLAGSWSVEVENASGHSSGQFAFAVQYAPEVAKIQTPNKPVPSKSIALIAEKKSPVEIEIVATASGGISKKPTQITPQQQAENEFRKAYELMQQGQASAAISGYETVLKLDAGHLVARQTLVRLLLENKRSAEAERLLQEGLQLDHRQSSLAMLLARIQVGRNELSEALETMQKSLPYAQQQADYQAFVAALLQRQNKHREAITYFQNAVQMSPRSGVWLMGMGISLHAEQRNEEAREVFNRALETRTLSAELQSFVKQQLKEL